MQEQSLSEAIEIEYEKLIASEDRKYDVIYALLTEYLKKVVTLIVREGSYLDTEALMDIVQESLAYIISYGLDRFEKGETLFASYCARIAKNKALDYVRSRNKKRCESLDNEETNYLNQIILDNNPERLVMETGRQLALCEQVKKGIQLLMDLKTKPYAIVASCFSLILFHKFNEETKELSSPGWAYTSLSPSTVYDGADEFLKQMYSWMPRLKLRWSESFAQGCKEDIDGELVGNIVFGEQFKVKDFENWSRRCKEKVKAQLEEDFDEGLEL